MSNTVGGARKSAKKSKTTYNVTEVQEEISPSVLEASGVSKKVSFMANDDSTTGEGMLKYAESLRKQRPMGSPSRSPRKSRPSSPSKIQQLGLDPYSSDYHKAFAREMYYDQMVNIVRPGKGSPKKIRHGGMNLFAAKGQSLRRGANNITVDDVITGPSTYTTRLSEKWGVLQLGDGATGIRDKNLREATEDVQRQFDALMNDMVNRRSGINKIHEVHSIMEAVYRPEPMRKHKSPTKHLINQVNSLTEHKKRISRGLHRGEYSQIYSISPGKTVVIEPQGGELPYDLADKNPAKFYSIVLNQEVKKCNVTMRNQLKFEWTYRPLLKILISVKDKLIDRAVDKIGEKFRPDIERALATGGPIEAEVMKALEENKLDLVDHENRLIFQNMSSEHEDKLIKRKSTDILDDEANVSINVPNQQRLSNASLTGDRIDTIEQQVLKFVK